MNLTELSNLVKVTEHLKNVINNAGVSRFSNATLSVLKKRLSEFDELFISEMLAYEDNNKSTAKVINEAIQAARTKMMEEKNPSLKLHPDLSKMLSPTSKEEPKVSEDKALKVKKTKKEPVKELVETTEQPTETKIANEPKQSQAVVPASSSKDPYLQDDSLAAMLAAEKQKIAAKKNKNL
jgi:hypothetical protein